MRPAVLLLLCALLLAPTACFKRPVYRDAFDQDRTSVRLRREVKGFSTVEQGYQHPFAISRSRAAHILSRLDLRVKHKNETKRVPAIPTEALYLIGEGMSQAFAEAKPDEQVVVMSIRRQRRLGVFDRKYLTSLIAYRQDDQLYIHMGLSDWEIPARVEARGLPVPELGGSGKGRLITSEGMTLIDDRVAAVDWSDAIFAKPTRTHVTAGGRVVRRTILMESTEEELAADPEPEPPPIPADLSPTALRALADLEDARRRGDVDDAEYAERKRKILESEMNP